MLEFTKEQNNKYLDLNNEKQRLQRTLENSINELKTGFSNEKQQLLNQISMLNKQNI